MRRFAPALIALATLATPASALADVGPEPEPETETGSSEAGEDGKDEGGDEEGSDCSVNAEADQSALFGLAALVLLVSGAALRKRG